MATIFDVAKKAGVSKSTVSRVINSNGYVSKESKKKILKAASELNYSPSILARQFRKQSTKKIGFVVKTYYPAVGELLSCSADVFKRHGYNVTVYFTKSKDEETFILESFKLHTLDALFFVANRNDWSYIAQYAQYGPIVTWRRTDHREIYSSYIDHYPLYQNILQYVYDKYGEVNIGHVLNSPEKNNTKARLRAIDEFQQSHPQANNSWKVFFPEQGHAGRDAAMDLLHLADRPDVVIVYSDYVAAEFIATLRDQGMEVPKDIKVFGFDNSDFGKFMNMSTVDTQLAMQTKNLSNRIISTLEKTEFEALTIEPQLVIRKSC